jgi:hypothetical protein
VTGQLIAPVIPSAAGSARRGPGRMRAGRPLPLASPPGRLEAVYGLGRIDASGRIADRSSASTPIITTAQWPQGGGTRVVVPPELRHATGVFATLFAVSDR